VPIQGGSLRLLCWAGYEAATFVKDFEQQWKCEVFGTTFDSDMDASNRVMNEPDWDLVNINNPYVNTFLYPAGKISALDQSDFSREAERMLPCLDRFLQCTYSANGESLIGICQRFGPFNLVIDKNQVDATTARDEGFHMADDIANKEKFGLLLYPEFNIMHAAIACDINPFNILSESEEKRVVSKLQQWKNDALVCSSDYNVLNQALIDHQIRFYVSGGVYTAGVARRAGHLNIQSITPERGPIDGRGGIAFVEVTSICQSGRNNKLANQYLRYMIEPKQCYRIAFAKGVHNPVAQMGDPEVMSMFSKEELASLQFSTLEQDMERCAPYASIPNLDRIRTASGLY